MSKETYFVFLVLLAGLALVFIMIGSQLKDAQRRVGQLEQQVQRLEERR